MFHRLRKEKTTYLSCNQWPVGGAMTRWKPERSCCLIPSKLEKLGKKSAFLRPLGVIWASITVTRNSEESQKEKPKNSFFRLKTLIDALI
uniref:Uncharacterized protein n=1 Tax=Romanomermis culicivorax TaxID=13658 RepID=A0A915JUJ4_ROMCU